MKQQAKPDASFEKAIRQHFLLHDNDQENGCLMKAVTSPKSLSQKVFFKIGA